MDYKILVAYKKGIFDTESEHIKMDISHIGIKKNFSVKIAQIYNISGAISKNEIREICKKILTDPITQDYYIVTPDASLKAHNWPPVGQPFRVAYDGNADNERDFSIEVFYKSGVTDSVADTVKIAIKDIGFSGNLSVVTGKKYFLKGNFSERELKQIAEKVLSNTVVEEYKMKLLKKFNNLTADLPAAGKADSGSQSPTSNGMLKSSFQHDKIGVFQQYQNRKYMKQIPISNAVEKELVGLSKKHLLSLNLGEMLAIQKYFRSLKREPTDVEIETIAQTWSEHCKHKTLTGSVEYKWKVEGGRWKVKRYKNLLKETIFKATKDLDKKWCICVFKDNAGIIEFDKKNAVAFKVETHNHPSAIEPYGGAGTGIGGVIRDILGVGLGAKPIMNTDVFCFGSPSSKHIPEGILTPERIFKGVVSGVRDYGNRMGIPTTNGAVLFDEGYLFNPLVYCGTVGILPKEKSFKKVLPGDLIVSVGGLTGRDGIHGATFSSDSLNSKISASVVQIGNPIVEKKLTDTILQARDKNLYNAITDCGAGGYSSAIGELAVFSGGARVYLEKVPLKYEGLEPWEIWVSEAQERMVLAVPKKKLKALLKVFSDEDVSTTVLGEFTDTGKLEVFYKKDSVCCLDLDFLHEGLPKVKNTARWKKPKKTKFDKNTDVQDELKKLLSSLNICSKEWVIRQYDFEVQAHTVIKPFVGIKNDGPSDAAVLKPYPDSDMCIAVSNGINLYGKYDAESMAAAAIDEALRNIVAVGGDLERTALLDNFCWGELKTPEQFGTLVKAAETCYELSLKYGVPFISGKDSLNNKYVLPSGEIVSIPPTLLISALSIIKDIKNCVTMDLKNPGNPIYILGVTSDEFPPEVNPLAARTLMRGLQKAIEAGTVASVHDCSEGGIGVACSEMCIAGELGMKIHLGRVPLKNRMKDSAVLFSETNSRFIVEVSKESDFEKIVKKNSETPKQVRGDTVEKVQQCHFAKIGEVIEEKKFLVLGQNGRKIVDSDVLKLKNLWKNGLIAN